MWYDIWSFSYKQQILNFWSRSEMVRKLRFRTGWSENCVFGPPGEPILSKILKYYFFIISFIQFNDVITFLKHFGKMTFLRLYFPLSRYILSTGIHIYPISYKEWLPTHCILGLWKQKFGVTSNLHLVGWWNAFSCGSR